MSKKLKELRDKAQSIKNIQQVTRAMKFVAAARWRKTHDRVARLRPYAAKLDEILAHALYDQSQEKTARHYYLEPRSPKRVCQVIITANRGLCGSFNSHLIKMAEANIHHNYPLQAQNGLLTIICIGRRGLEYFRKNYGHCRIVADYVNLLKDPSIESVASLSKTLLSAFDNLEYDLIEVTYSRFKNAAVHLPVVAKWLPISNREVAQSFRDDRPKFIFEPSSFKFLSQIIPFVLHHDFRRYLLETEASEHGARLTAMSKATENAEKLLQENKRAYNKARQAAITEELIEIVNGAEALRKG